MLRQFLVSIAVSVCNIAIHAIVMAAHIAEVVAWSIAYAIVGVAPPGTDLIYFAFVNYTTLGYGDVTPLQRWSLLGPMTAMNGVLLFGWSTAVIFAVLQKALMTGISR
jgi:Ion channel